MLFRSSKLYTYTTYENDRFHDASATSDPKVLVPKLGKKAIDLKKDEWDAGKIKFKVAEDVILEFPHKAIKMTRSADGKTLHGALHI